MAQNGLVLNQVDTQDRATHLLEFSIDATLATSKPERESHQSLRRRVVFVSLRHTWQAACVSEVV
jgi:hypothetical protein